MQAATPGELLSRAERASQENALIELRLDYLKQPAAAIQPLRDFLRSTPQTMVIATCRKQTYGGGFKGTIEAEWEILKKAGMAGCSMVDVELQSGERMSAGQLEELRHHANLIISYHDFTTTPPLAPILARMRRLPADMYKLVPTANTWRQNIELLRFLDQHSGEQPLVAFCMGEAGLLSRLLSLRMGGAFTFAALETAEATAPGQPDLHEMRERFHIESLNRATRVYGVLGYPLGHSLSPRMHNAAYRRVGLNAIYLPLPSKRGVEVLDLADEIPLSGMSVTQPYKSEFLKRMERLDPMAKAVGAINTIVRSQGRFYGYNTDVAGIVDTLSRAMPLRGAKILVVGAGGAARAAAYGLRAQGAQITIYNRTRSRGQKLAQAVKGKVVSRAELKKASFQAIVHATPVGQYPKVKEAALDHDEIHAPIVFDLVYNPQETELARRARAAGAQVIPGVEMFVLQGARQFELWTGTPAPVDDMRREVLAALAETAGA